MDRTPVTQQHRAQQRGAAADGGAAHQLAWKRGADRLVPPNLPSHVNRLRCAHPPILGVRTLVERVPPLLVLEPQLHRPSSRGAVRRRAVSHEAQSADLFRSNLSPFQLLFVTMREY